MFDQFGGFGHGAPPAPYYAPQPQPARQPVQPRPQPVAAKPQPPKPKPPEPPRTVAVPAPDELGIALDAPVAVPAPRDLGIDLD